MFLYSSCKRSEIVADKVVFYNEGMNSSLMKKKRRKEGMDVDDLGDLYRLSSKQEKCL